MSDVETTRKIEELRNNLTEKLGELNRRAHRARDVLTPSTYWDNRWIRIGIGAAIGFAVGDLRHASPRAREGLVHAMVRSGLVAAVGALVARALAPPRGDS